MGSSSPGGGQWIYASPCFWRWYGFCDGPVSFFWQLVLTSWVVGCCGADIHSVRLMSRPASRCKCTGPAARFGSRKMGVSGYKQFRAFGDRMDSVMSRSARFGSSHWGYSGAGTPPDRITFRFPAEANGPDQFPVLATSRRRWAARELSNVTGWSWRACWWWGVGLFWARLFLSSETSVSRYQPILFLCDGVG